MSADTPRSFATSESSPAASPRTPAAGEEHDVAPGQDAWEEELLSQRDAALAMARELSRQHDQQKDTLERRAKNAEDLRENAENAYLKRKTTQRNQPEVHVRLMALVGGSLSAWLICVALGLAWAPRASLALGLPCTVVMAAVCSRRMPNPRAKRRML